MVVFIILLIILGLVGAFATAVSFLKHFEDEALEPLQEIDSSRFCKVHNWDKIKLVDAEHAKDFLENKFDLSKVPDRTICLDCGFVPQLDKMIKSDYLSNVRQAIYKNRKLEEDLGFARELKEELLRELSSTYEENLVREVCARYDIFLDVLPTLIENKRFEKALQRLSLLDSPKDLPSSTDKN